MKAINIYVEDADYDALNKVKGERSWRELLLSLIIPTKKATP